MKMSADILYINDMPFLTIVLHDIHYGTIEIVDNLKYLTLELELINMVKFYTIRGFNIILITVGIQFKALKDRNMVGVKFNIISKEEHVPIIKKFHYVVEE